MSVGVMEHYKLIYLRGLYPLRVYYESIKREPKIRGIKKCRCDERLQTKTKDKLSLKREGKKENPY
jgi:hypothetical protein